MRTRSLPSIRDLQLFRSEKEIASEGSLRFGGACECTRQGNTLGTSSRHWRSVARGYWWSLHKTKQAAASPFHCCLVSPGSRAALTARPNHV